VYAHVVPSPQVTASPDWRCPISRCPIKFRDLDDAAARLGGPLAPAPRVGIAPIGATSQVGVAPGGWAYPVVDGIPMLLAPERLYPNGNGPEADVTVAPYAEAYSEIEPYSRHSDLDANATVIVNEGARLQYLSIVGNSWAPWPTPGIWVGGGDDIGAQIHSLSHLAPIANRAVLQIGGNGIHGLNMVAAGAASLVLISPVLEELRWCRAVAAAAGLRDHLAVAAGLAEELPLPDSAFDVVYSPSCLHHTVTSRSFPEIARVLARGGRFASVDIYRSVLYEVGVRWFGKRDPNVFCRPLDRERLAPAHVLPNVKMSWHGAVFRYPLSVLSRKGVEPPFRWLLRFASVEDSLSRRFRILAPMASLVSLTATSSSEPSGPEPHLVARDVSGGFTDADGSHLVSLG
jgi:SAM-dependent methyltransferase